MSMNFAQIALVSTLLAGGAAQAQPLECPLVPEVLAQAKGAAANISVDKLGTRIADTVSSAGNLHPIANRIKSELPNASNAEVADILIAAYCQNLAATQPPPKNGAQMLTDFEQMAYNAVYNPPTQEAEKGGWLYN